MTGSIIADEAFARGQIGLAVADERLFVRQRFGPLSAWLPRVGTSICDSPLLIHMEADFARLREEGGEIVLPSMRAALEGRRVTIAIAWSARAQGYLIVTTPDHGSEQIDRLLASDRREKQLLQQQADAAAARLKVADALYRDIVESSGNLVLRFTPDFRLVFANRAAASFLGKAQDALIGEALDGLFPSQGAPWRLGRGAERRSFETSARDARGRAFWLSWDIRFLGPEAGGEFQAVARDVTAERRLRVEREKAQEEARAAAVAHERLRIAHDLHDTLVRSIVTMIAEARLIAKKTADPEAKKALTELDAHARQGLWEAREAIAQMRETRREDADLRAIALAFQARWPDVAVTLDFAAERALAPQTESLFAAILREALRNIELHSGAKNVRVALHVNDARAELVIEDDGAGFDPAAPTPGHFGVLGMRERASLAGATLEVESAPGEGARLTLSVSLTG